MKPTFIALLALCLCLPLASADKQEQRGALIPPELVAAKKTYDEGKYKEASLLFAKELIREQNKLRPSWEKLAHLNNQVGVCLLHTGLYDRALAFSKKSLEIRLKHLGPEHLEVVASYNNIGGAHLK